MCCLFILYSFQLEYDSARCPLRMARLGGGYPRYDVLVVTWDLSETVSPNLGRGNGSNHTLVIVDASPYRWTDGVGSFPLIGTIDLHNIHALMLFIPFRLFPHVTIMPRDIYDGGNN
jgi:hypothetical protein